MNYHFSDFTEFEYRKLIRVAKNGRKFICFTDYRKVGKAFLCRHDSKVNCFSFHNPDVGNWLDIDQDELLGMVNAYGRYISKYYAYVSDSNGYWRFRRLEEVLHEEADKLHVLTLPFSGHREL